MSSIMSEQRKQRWASMSAEKRAAQVESMHAWQKMLWTEEMDAKLRADWGSVASRDIAKAFNVSQGTIARRVKKLGLTLTEEQRSALNKAGVQKSLALHPRQALPPKKRIRRKMRLIDPWKSR
jgi:hypothetical protein